MMVGHHFCMFFHDLVFLFQVAINLIVQHIKDILSGKVSHTNHKSVTKRIRRESDSFLSRPH